jgi:hypothetical protein
MLTDACRRQAASGSDHSMQPTSAASADYIEDIAGNQTSRIPAPAVSGQSQAALAPHSTVSTEILPECILRSN